MDRCLDRIAHSVSEKNPRRLCRPGSTLACTLRVLLCVACFGLLLCLSPVVGAWTARLVNPHYNCTDYFECQVHCFVNPGEPPAAHNSSILASCGGMGFVGYALVGIAAVLLWGAWRWSRRLTDEAYYALWPELDDEPEPLADWSAINDHRQHSSDEEHNE